MLTFNNIPKDHKRVDVALDLLIDYLLALESLEPSSACVGPSEVLPTRLVSNPSKSSRRKRLPRPTLSS